MRIEVSFGVEKLREEVNATPLKFELALVIERQSVKVKSCDCDCCSRQTVGVSKVVEGGCLR